MENCRNKQFISFKLHVILSNFMESCTLLFHPTQNMSHPSVQSVLPVSHLVALSVIRSAVMISQCLCSSDLYFLLVAPKSKSNIASNIWQCIYAEEKPLNEKVLKKKKEKSSQ